MHRSNCKRKNKPDSCVYVCFSACVRSRVFVFCVYIYIYMWAHECMCLCVCIYVCVWETVYAILHSDFNIAPCSQRILTFASWTAEFTNTGRCSRSLNTHSASSTSASLRPTRFWKTVSVSYYMRNKLRLLISLFLYYFTVVR